MVSQPFRFKKFEVAQSGAAHLVGTDGILLGASAAVEPGDRRILDIGTGTGLVALMLAQRTENQHVYETFKSFVNVHPTILGLEIHAQSVCCAAENFGKSAWKNRLKVVEKSVQNFSTTTFETFDLIVSNPPFFSEKIISPDPNRRLARQIETLPPLDLILSVKKLLAPAGRFCVILPKKEGQNFCEMAAVNGLCFSKIIKIKSRTEKMVERVLLEFRRQPVFFGKEKLTIFGDDGKFSAAFLELTKDFYL